ncbi:hypothetical protein EDC01DRAFT_629415 [Geopyxis carbonaria]|nr:hypothetical protein EDC01DRAFT_629415 [Geopyxis carbonaria]
MSYSPKHKESLNPTSAGGSNVDIIDGRKLAMLHLEDNVGLSSASNLESPRELEAENESDEEEEVPDEFTHLPIANTEIVLGKRVRLDVHQVASDQYTTSLDKLIEPRSKLHLIGDDKFHQNPSLSPFKHALSTPDYKLPQQASSTSNNLAMEDNEDLDTEYEDCACPFCKGEEDSQDEEDEQPVVLTTLQGGGSQQTSKRSSADLENNQPPPKRTSKNLGLPANNGEKAGGDGFEDDGDGMQHSFRLSSSITVEPKLFRCPYYEHNPTRFAKCAKQKDRALAKMNSILMWPKGNMSIENILNPYSVLGVAIDDLKVPKEDCDKAQKLRKQSAGVEKLGVADKANTLEGVKFILFSKCNGTNCQCLDSRRVSVSTTNVPQGTFLGPSSERIQNKPSTTDGGVDNLAFIRKMAEYFNTHVENASHVEEYRPEVPAPGKPHQQDRGQYNGESGSSNGLPSTSHASDLILPDSNTTDRPYEGLHSGDPMVGHYEQPYGYDLSANSLAPDISITGLQFSMEQAMASQSRMDEITMEGTALAAGLAFQNAARAQSEEVRSESSGVLDLNYQFESSHDNQSILQQNVRPGQYLHRELQY